MIALGDIPDRAFPDQAFCDWYTEEWEPYRRWASDLREAQRRRRVWFVLRRLLRLREGRIIAILYYWQGLPL
jgi:hypothetical protein